MKPVEEAFASGSFRRVVLPGIILTIGLHPILSMWLPRLGATYGVSTTFILITEVVFFGLVLSSGLQWIYYLYEGFRLPKLTALARRVNESKLERSLERRRVLQRGRSFEELTLVEQEEVTRIYEYLVDFPLRPAAGGGVERYAERPTRLGNIIATYELYAETRYGVDGVHYWHHLLGLAPQTTRREFDDQYSFSESLVLASFAGVVVAAIHAICLLGFLLARSFPTAITVVFTPLASFLLLLFGVGVWVFFYRASWPAHREAGAIMRATIDAAMPDFKKWIDSIEAPVSADARRKIAEITEYLKALHE